jgi:hypothetical protein
MPSKTKDARRQRLITVGNNLAAALRPFYDQIRAETNCDDCTMIRLRKDVLAILPETLMSMRPGLLQLCKKHQPDPGPEEPSGSYPEDDTIPF